MKISKKLYGNFQISVKYPIEITINKKEKFSRCHKLFKIALFWVK